MSSGPDPATTEWVPIWNPVSVGPIGPVGPQGEQGDQGIQGIQGEIGPIGPQGIQGVKGDKGDKGDQGIQGVQGNQGVQGVKGDTGEKWFTGSGVPAGSLANSLVGDWYLDSATGDYYEKTGTTAWTLRGNLRGPQGIQGIQGIQGNTGSQGTPGEKWFSGSGVPAGNLAGSIVGDWYLNTANGDVYEKTAASTWTLRANIKGPSGATAAHHATHEPGGADYLVNSAWLNTKNVFTNRWQEISAAAPFLAITDTNMAANSRTWILFNDAGPLKFQATNDSLAAPVTPLTLNRDGTIDFGGLIRVIGPAPSIDFNETDQPVDGKKWTLAFDAGLLQLQVKTDAGSVALTALTVERAGHVTVTGQMRLADLNPALTIGPVNNGSPALRRTDAVLEVVLADGSNYASLRAAAFISVVAGTYLADLSVSGNTAFYGPIMSIASQIDLSGGGGTVYNTAPLEIVMASYPRVAFHWPGVTAAQIGMDSGGTIRTFDNPGTGYAAFACAGLTATNNFISYGYVQSMGVHYPCRIDIAPALQGSYYWGSHGGYGMYTNTGIYAVGAIYGQVYLNHGGYYGFLHSHALTYDNPNALDDYEEGDWIPRIDIPDAEYTEQRGSYTKIGRMVFINGRIRLAKLVTGRARILGLPFVPAEGTEGDYYVQDLAAGRLVRFSFSIQAPS